MSNVDLNESLVVDQLLPHQLRDRLKAKTRDEIELILKDFSDFARMRVWLVLQTHENCPSPVDLEKGVNIKNASVRERTIHAAVLCNDSNTTQSNYGKALMKDLVDENETACEEKGENEERDRDAAAAYYNYACFLKEKHGIEAARSVIKYLLFAADQGYADAQYLTGMIGGEFLLLDGNMRNPLRLIAEAKKQGHPDAQMYAKVKKTCPHNSHNDNFEAMAEVSERVDSSMDFKEALNRYAEERFKSRGYKLNKWLNNF